MRNSLIVSAAAHATIVVLALVVFPSPEELSPVQTRALPVELITIGEVTNLKRQQKVEKPKPVEEPKPPQPKPVEKTRVEPKPEPAPPPPPEKKAEPMPDKAVEKEKEKEKPREVEKKKEAPKPPQKKPEKKKTFDPNQIAKLLDKSPDTSPKSEQYEAEEDFDAPVTDDPAAALTMSEMDAVRQRIQKCWNVRDFVGSADAGKLFAKIHVNLNQDGSVSGFPSIVETSRVPLSRLFAERAIQTVRDCAPYDFLPADKFGNWRDNTFNFDMSGMM